MRRSSDRLRKSAPSIINVLLQKEKAAGLLVFLTVYHARVSYSKQAGRFTKSGGEPISGEAIRPQAVIRQSNLACADIHLLDGKHLLNFLGMMRFTRSIFERVVRPLWERLKDASQMGSLLRVEQDIAARIEAERRHIPGQAKLPLYEAQGLFEEEMSEEAYRKHLMSQIVEAFHEYARHQAEQGHDETYFVGEATKGVRLLDIMLRRYNVVAANPPYMSHRNMSSVMSDYLKRYYAASKGDLYAAFIDRCTELLAPGGRLAMITQQSFMFISSYENLRANLAEQVAIETMIHVGPHAFAEIGGEKVNTTLYILRREPDASRRTNSIGVYFRLVREPDAEAKQHGFELALAALRRGDTAPAVYRYRQGEFAVIPGAPWVYWITPGLRRLFQTLPKLGEVAQPVVGLQTSDNFRFLRYWWEVGASLISFGCADAQQALVTGKRWFPHMKGGSFRRWWGNQEYVVNWAEDGAELRAFTPMANFLYDIVGVMCRYI